MPQAPSRSRSVSAKYDVRFAKKNRRRSRVFGECGSPEVRREQAAPGVIHEPAPEARGPAVGVDLVMRDLVTGSLELDRSEAPHRQLPGPRRLEPREPAWEMDERNLHLRERGYRAVRLASIHRQRTRLAARLPGRAEPVAKASRPGNRCHVRLARPPVLQSRRPPGCTSPTRRASTTSSAAPSRLSTGMARDLRFDELVTDDALRDAVLAQGADFVAGTEQGLPPGVAGRLGLGAPPASRARSSSSGRTASTACRLGLDHAWLRACLSPYLLDVGAGVSAHVAEAFGMRPLVHGLAATDADRVASQLWHYDFDKHLLKAFLFLDDVDAETGPFEYVAGSQPGGPHHNVRPWKPMGFGRVQGGRGQAHRARTRRSGPSPRRAERSSSATQRGLHRGG